MTRLRYLSSDLELQLASDIKQLIERATESVISKANAELVMLNWSIGKLIKLQIENNTRADYGEQIVTTIRMEPLVAVRT